jgi:chromate transporter
MHPEPEEGSVPQLGYGQLFLRFLKFGLLAFGGPVAQIAMLRHELVEQERWISTPRFNRVLAVYQALPGPEAHELCVYFGMLARGRIGGVLAGIGFMLPGLLLVLILSALYVRFAGTSIWFNALFLGAQPAVAALIVRGVHRIGTGALKGGAWLWVAALLAAASEFLGAPFYIPLLGGGLLCWLFQTGRRVPAVLTTLALAAGAFLLRQTELTTTIQGAVGTVTPATSESLFIAGLRGGLLTFGGAYTAIPFVRHDAVVVGQWLTDAQFLDGIAISGVLPAPMVIFVTFVGFVAAGMGGALAATLGMFLPAFLITLLGHSVLEKIIENRGIHSFLDGITAAVVGVIAATSVRLFAGAVPNWIAAGIFLGTLILLYRWKSGWSTAVAVMAAAVIGLVFLR